MTLIVSHSSPVDVSCSPGTSNIDLEPPQFQIIPRSLVIVMRHHHGSCGKMEILLPCFRWDIRRVRFDPSPYDTKS